MSVFVRASLQGTPKTSPGHVALHHMPGLPMNLQYHFPRLGLQHRALHLNLQNLQLLTPPLPPCSTPPRRPNIATGFTSNPNSARAQARAARPAWPGAPRALAGQL